MNESLRPDKMTIVYKKRTGEIKNIYEDIQSIKILFGEDAEDYSNIYDLLIVDYDFNLFSYGNLLCVLEGKLKFKNTDSLKKYI